MNRFATIIFLLGLLIATVAWSEIYWTLDASLRTAAAEKIDAERNTPPIKYLSIAILNKDMQPGETLRGRVTYDRRRNCQATSKRSIIKIEEGGAEEIAYTDNVDQVPNAAGESINLIFTMKLPPLPPGCYVFRAIGRHDCDGRIFTIEVPSAGFCVVAGTKFWRLCT